MTQTKQTAQIEHVESMQRNTTQDAARKSQIINDLYQSYIDADEKNSNLILEELLDKLGKNYTGLVTKKLENANCYSRDAVDDVLEDASLDIWKMVVNSRFHKSVQASFAAYCATIYRNKTVDFIRALCKQQKQYGFVDSLDRDISEDGDTLGNFVGDSSAGSTPASHYEEQIRQNLLRTLFLMYCQSLTEKPVPPRGLALYYAQVAPHLLHVLEEEDTILDSKLSSPKWAHQKMGRYTISQLSDRSEQELEHYISPALAWCAAFRQQLTDPIPLPGQKQPTTLGDLIYTDAYTQKQTGHMADYMHQQIMQELARRIQQDEHLTSMVVAYVQNMDSLYHRMGGKRK